VVVRNSWKRLFLLLIACSQLAATCQGTETGNPGTESTANSYSNDDFGVSTSYEEGWTVSEVGVISHSSAPPSSGSGAQPVPTSTPAIDTSNAPSTFFTDGISTATISYVTLSTEPSTLLSYLQGIFADRTFQSYSNGQISGFLYDNPEAGSTGGDLAEYYFLQEKLLVYMVVEIFEENDGFGKFGTIIESLNFQ